MKLKEIHRTSTIAWSPLSTPLLATGTVAGALDESFSNDSQLEIWAPDFLNKQEYDLGGEGHNGPRGSVANTARFNRIAWGQADGSRPEGVIAAGMENGELAIWDPSKIVVHVNPSEALLLKNSTHTGPVRGLDFNPIQSTLFASGGINGEVMTSPSYLRLGLLSPLGIYLDLKDPSKPYSPGTRSSKLDEVSALAWNNQVPHVLATSSGTGYTVVWDLRGKREVVALAYGGGAGGAQAGSGRRGMSDVAWHPDNATRLVTSSEDDTSPIVMVWDLRNARAPEKILTGHEKGVLSLSWCKQDADLLLSSGKDNRALCWNPQTSEIIGELPSADNWAFQVQWCPRNPDLLATAFFDGTVGLHSIQSTNDVSQSEIGIASPQPDGADVFDNPSFARTNQVSFTLKQPPKWLCRPASASFGYCGQLVSVSNLMSKEGRHQSGVVHIRKLVTEDSVVTRAERLLQAVDAQDLPAIATERSAEAENIAAESAAGWKALLSLFRADSRDELVTLLGFSKAEIAERVAEAIAKLRSAAEEESTPLTVVKSPSEEDLTDYKPHEPVVSFAEPERSPTASAEDLLDATPSEVSAGAASDASNMTPLPDAESTTTAPSLFGDDAPAGTPQLDAAADFFSTMGLNQSANEDAPVVPHTNYGVDSSVAATIGSRPSSAASDTLKSHTFRIYPADESETDRLVTKALVVGDFESAVSLCLSVERFADAILLAVKGGPELLARTQKAYFERRTVALPYLRLFQSVVTNDLADIVQNAELQDWQEIFVVLCTFARADEFGGLAEQLGARLEFQGSLARSEHATEAPELRKNATLAYLAAGRLERLVNIWVEELAEEEKRILANDTASGVSRYTAYARALQTFIEKVTVFRAAASYVDKDLEQTETADGDAAAGTYKLSGLYDRYFEYADFLATQGLVKHAVAFLKLTPPSYKGLPDTQVGLAAGRERLLIAAGVTAAPVASSSLAPVPAPASIPPLPAVPMVAPTSTSTHTYSHYTPITQQQAARSTVAAPPAPGYNSYAPANVHPIANNPYAPAQPAQPPQPYQPLAPLTYPSGNAYNQLPPQPHGGQVVPPPSQAYGAAKPPPPPTAPPPKRRENGGWNDAPSMPERRTPSGSANKLAAITSPFPNAGPVQGLVSSPMGLARGQSPVSVPPPPRPGSVQARAPPPPAQGRIPVPPSHMTPAPGPYPPTGPGPVPLQSAPPPNLIPPGQQLPPRQPPAGQYAPPPPRGHVTPAPPPHHYSHGTPPPPPGAGLSQQSPPQARQVPLPSSGPYGRVASPLQQPPHPGIAPPPPPGPARAPPPPGGPSQGFVGQHTAVPPARTPSQGPAPPKYPPGDRTHIPDSLRPIYTLVSQQFNQLKQTTPASQRRLIDDLERRINPLFDALNCETLSTAVVGQLGELTKAMANHDRELALAIHVDMLTRTSGEDITLWMSGVKQLIMRL